MASREFIEKFKVPAAAEDVVDRMIPPMEQEFLLGVPPDTVFAPEEALGWLSKAAGRPIDLDEGRALLRLAYERGVLDMLGKSLAWEQVATVSARLDADVPAWGLAMGRYKLADFYSFLDVYAVVEAAAWAALPAETRAALDEGYLERYVGQCKGGEEVPTLDEICPMDEVVASILADERPIYLSPCDCLALYDKVPGSENGRGGGTQDGFPERCLSYRTAPGSYASRGISRRITREEAAEVVREADRRGLVHTINPNAICNCGPQWCYLFRGRERLGTGHAWPKENYRVRLLHDEQMLEKTPDGAFAGPDGSGGGKGRRDNMSGCTGCGICVKRCPFGVLALEGGSLVADLDKCVGCGLCVNTCPAGALGLEAKNEG